MQTISMQEVEIAIKKYGDVVLTKNSKNNIVVMSIEQYKKKILKDRIEEKLLKAEKQIEEGKVVRAEDVFKELEKEYGF